MGENIRDQSMVNRRPFLIDQAGRWAGLRNREVILDVLECGLATVELGVDCMGTVAVNGCDDGTIGRHLGEIRRPSKQRRGDEPCEEL